MPITPAVQEVVPHLSQNCWCIVYLFLFPFARNSHSPPQAQAQFGDCPLLLIGLQIIVPVPMALWAPGGVDPTPPHLTSPQVCPLGHCRFPRSTPNLVEFPVPKLKEDLPIVGVYCWWMELTQEFEALPYCSSHSFPDTTPPPPFRSFGGGPQHGIPIGPQLDGWLYYHYPIPNSQA